MEEAGMEKNSRWKLYSADFFFLLVLSCSSFEWSRFLGRLCQSSEKFLLYKKQFNRSLIFPIEEIESLKCNQKEGKECLDSFWGTTDFKLRTKYQNLPSICLFSRKVHNQDK